MGEFDALRKGDVPPRIPEGFVGFEELLVLCGKLFSIPKFDELKIEKIYLSSKILAAGVSVGTGII